MPGVTPQQYQPEETLSLIAERAKTLEGEGKPALFDIQLNRRDRAAGFPINIASLTQATLEHIQDPMRWVPMLCGGGEYTLNVRHHSIAGRIGGPYPFTCTTEGPGMQPHPPNPLVTLRSDWQGPKLVTPPPPDPAQPTTPGHTNGAVATGPVTTGYGLPSFQPSGPSQTDRERELQQQLADMKATHARLEAESKAAAALDAVKREAAERIREAEQRAEQARRESEQRLREMDTKIAAITAAASAPPPPKVDTLQTVSTIVQLLTPFITQLLNSMHESRQAMLKTNEEQNRRQLEANEKQHTATLELLRAVQAKPGMSEEMKLLIETLRAQASQAGGSGAADLMARMAEAMGTVTKSSIAMVETTVEALGGEPDHPAVIAIREGVGALKSLMVGNKEAAMRSVKPQLPAGQQRQAPRLAPDEIAVINNMRRQKAAQRGQQAQQPSPPAQQAQPPPGGPQAVRVGPPPKTAPATVIEFKPPAQPAEAAPATEPGAPVPASPVIVAAPTPGVTAEGFPEAAPGTGLSHFEMLAAGVLGMKNPDEVASYFINLVKSDEPSMKAALEQHDKSPQALLIATVGEEFIGANLPYFKELGSLIDQKGTEAQLWKEASEEDRAADEADDAAEGEEEEAPALEPT